MGFEYIEPARDGYFFEGPAQRFTQAEIALKNDAEYARNRAAMPAIVEAGFIRYPLTTRTVDGQVVEKEAWLHPVFEPSCTEGFLERHGMRFNIYIPSYGRAGKTLTTRMLDRYGASNYYLCIDASQFEAYAAAYPIERLVIRDISFREPEMLDAASSMQHAITLAGHAPLCNFTLALSRSLGESHFWFSDDDIKTLGMKFRKPGVVVDDKAKHDPNDYWTNNALKPSAGFDYQEFMHRLEAVALQSRNVGFLGLEKHGIAFRDPAMWRMGTKVFCYYLTSNATQIAHYSRQNNDLVTSLELGRHGLVNMLFKGIGYDSEATQKGDGGQVDMYRTVGVGDKAKVAVRAQPAGVTITYRNSRVHHQAPFSHQPRRVVGAPVSP